MRGVLLTGRLSSSLSDTPSCLVAWPRVIYLPAHPLLRAPILSFEAVTLDAMCRLIQLATMLFWTGGTPQMAP